MKLLFLHRLVALALVPCILAEPAVGQIRDQISESRMPISASCSRLSALTLMQALAAPAAVSGAPANRIWQIAELAAGFIDGSPAARAFDEAKAAWDKATPGSLDSELAWKRMQYALGGMDPGTAPYDEREHFEPILPQLKLAAKQGIRTFEHLNLSILAVKLGTFLKWSQLHIVKSASRILIQGEWRTYIEGRHLPIRQEIHREVVDAMVHAFAQALPVSKNISDSSIETALSTARQVGMEKHAELNLDHGMPPKREVAKPLKPLQGTLPSKSLFQPGEAPSRLRMDTVNELFKFMIGKLKMDVAQAAAIREAVHRQQAQAGWTSKDDLLAFIQKTFQGLSKKSLKELYWWERTLSDLPSRYLFSLVSGIAERAHDGSLKRVALSVGEIILRQPALGTHYSSNSEIFRSQDPAAPARVWLDPDFRRLMTLEILKSLYSLGHTTLNVQYEGRLRVMSIPDFWSNIRDGLYPKGVVFTQIRNYKGLNQLDRTAFILETLESKSANVSYAAMAIDAAAFEALARDLDLAKKPPRSPMLYVHPWAVIAAVIVAILTDPHSSPSLILSAYNLILAVIFFCLVGASAAGRRGIYFIIWGALAIMPYPKFKVRLRLNLRSWRQETDAVAREAA